MRVVRFWPLAAGLLLLAGLWLGPLPGMARRAFSPHMILHLGVMVVAAPLIVIGFMRLSPPDLVPRFRYLGAFAASVFDFAVVWGWHVPALHEAAARLDPAFALQQLSFLAAGLWLWWICLAGRDAGSGAAGAFAMLFASMHMAMLGVLLVLAPTLVYAPQFCLGAFGLDPLQDQQFGGGLMALFGALPYVAGGAYLASRLTVQEA
ncbi:cytochrome c oxidase assembly protein [uncultured Hoeflea sp.]|uniref:cytochrome c oxidase assembly protein n=1 Tax=uncultured Hoeflea sp. TaxID=538666 RepID=UPI0030EBBDAC|tara:strand:+ start:40899 stop:41516 length:618 start_codon:yes stop_codon:yes gene_type:complete